MYCPELLSVGFQYKPIAEGQEIDFTVGKIPDESHNCVNSSLELLEYVRFTNTNVELDTITVSTDFVRDPERFIQICSSIVGSTFLTISPEFECLDR